MIFDEGFARVDQLKPLLMVLQPLLKDRARSPQFFGPAIERLGFIDLVAAWVCEAEQSVRLALKSLVPVGGLQALVLVLLGCLFFASPTLQALTQIFADPCQGCLLYTSPSPRDLSTSRMPSSA